MEYNIAVIPGDGIGPEIIREARKVLNAIGKNTAIALSTPKFLWEAYPLMQQGYRLQRRLFGLVNEVIRFCSVL